MSSTCFETEVHLQEDGCTYRYGIVCLHAYRVLSGVLHVILCDVCYCTVFYCIP